MFKNTLLSFLVLAAGGTAAWFISTHASGSAIAAHADDHGTGHEDHSTIGEARGPNGGRLLTDGDFSVELAIHERGVPPEFRAWFTRSGRPVPPDEVDLHVQLRRPDGATDDHDFQPDGDYARGQSEVYEPHSFDYVVEASHSGNTFRWEFEAPDMQTMIPPDSAERAGVATAEAGPAVLPDLLSVYGEIKPNANQVARATPRFSGLVCDAFKSIGDTVESGEVVAVIESNETLIKFDVKAPISGTIVERNVTTGETVTAGQPLYVIANLSEVWIDLAVPRREIAKVHTGQEVRLHTEDEGAIVPARIDSILPAGTAASQSMIARIVLPDKNGLWRPGWIAKADIVIAEHEVPVAVKESALQTLFDFTVVFSRHGELYQARPLELGRRGGEYVEVLKGLNPGERYVTENSFLIKADILKSGAGHDH